MGSNYHQAVLPPRVGRALHAWHKDARKRVKIGSLFSFGRKRNKSGLGEEQALSPKDPESNSLSPPTSLIMEDSTMERYNTTTQQRAHVDSLSLQRLECIVILRLR